MITGVFSKLFSKVQNKLSNGTYPQAPIRKELGTAAKKLAEKTEPDKDSVILTYKNLKGEIEEVMVTQKEVEEINASHAEILQKAGIPSQERLQNDPNFGKENSYTGPKDVWSKW